MEKKRKNRTQLKIASLFLLGLFCLSINQGVAAKRSDDVKLTTDPPSVSNRLNRSCGEAMVFDKDAGRMVRKNRVDLIVVKVEMMTRSGGNVAVKPTIQNICPDRTEGNFEVSMGDVVTTFSSLAGNATYTLDRWTNVSEADSIRVKVDYGNEIEEISEGNNICNARYNRTLSNQTFTCTP